MKSVLKISITLAAAISLFWFGWFMNDMSRFAEGVVVDSKINKLEFVKDDAPIVSRVNSDSIPVQNPCEIDSLLQVILFDRFENLREIISDHRINEISNHIDFPLGLRSAYAFGYEAENDTVLLTDEKFVSGFDSFFRKPFVDSLRLKNETFKLYKKGNEIRWSVHLSTWDPANEKRDHGLECSHSMWGYATDSILRIDAFNLLCGGVM